MTATTINTPRILTVIVNYGTADLVISNFASLIRELADFPNSKTVIVDNASPGTDGARLVDFASRPEWRDRVTVIKSDENLGFAKGNNLAIRAALAGEEPPDYVFLLNPDAYLLPNALSGLVAFMEAHPQAGIAGPRLESEDGAQRCSAFRFFSVASEFESAAKTGVFSKLLGPWRVAPPPAEKEQPADWICGAAALIRREVFEDAGLFDENYFLYYEETDFMRQALKAGWRTWYVPSLRAVHLEGQSSGVVEGKLKTRLAPDYWYQSRAYYFRKNHGRFYAFLADVAWLAGASFYYLRKVLTGARDPALGAAIKRFVKNQFGGGLSPATHGGGE